MCRGHGTHVIKVATVAYTIVICTLKAAFKYKCSLPYRLTHQIQPFLWGQKYQLKDDEVEYFM